MNQLPLEVWRSEIGGYNPWHFWGLADTDKLALSSQCNTLVYEYNWQGTHAAGRSEIRSAIRTAEDRLREHLHFSVGRRFLVDTIDYPRPTTAAHQFVSPAGNRDRWMNITLSEGHVRNIGAETRALIEDATVTYSDDDGDGINETFTLTVTTSITDPDEIAVYFKSADRLDGAAVSERWRIAPVQVSISGGVATIKGRAYLLVRPILYEGLSVSGLDPSDSGNFATSLEVYRRYTDSTGQTTDDAQAVLVWETAPYPPWAAGCSFDSSIAFTTNSRDPAAIGLAVARAQIRNARLGEVTIGRAVYDSDTGQWIGADWGSYRQPDRVIVRYEAGAPLSTVENTLNQAGVKGNWDTVVARLAAAELVDAICACDTANRTLWRWQFDLARAAGAADEQYRIDDRDLANPLGTRAGAVYAWQRIRQLRVQHSFNIG